MTAGTRPSTFAELFTPKLVTVLREGYGVADFRADAVAGLTVAIVALPLSMAIAIASGVDARIAGSTPPSSAASSCRRWAAAASRSAARPARSSFWSRRPSSEHGIDGLVLATMLSGLILLAVGLLRLGTYIKYIPYPVTVGFTAGIAVIIFASQIKELLGLTLAGTEPARSCRSSQALAAALPTVNPAAVAVAGSRRGHHRPGAAYRPHWPGFLIAVALRLVLAWLLRPAGRDHRHPLRRHSAALPAPPAARRLASSAIAAVLPDALVLRAARRHREPALRRGRRQHDGPAPPLELRARGPGRGQHRLGAVRRHLRHRHDRPHRDQRPRRRARAGLRHAARAVPAALHARGRAARRATSRSRRSPPCWPWSPGTWPRSTSSPRCSAPRAATPSCSLATFLLVVFRDLTEGILVGFGIGALLFMHRMAQAVEVEAGLRRSRRTIADSGTRATSVTTPALATDPDVVVYRISGAFFFGAAATVGVRARPPRRTAQSLRPRRLGRAVARLDCGGDHPGLREKSSAAGSGGVHRRRAPRHPANAPRTRCAPAVGSISVRPRRSHRGGTPGWRLKAASPWSVRCGADKTTTTHPPPS